MTDSVLPRTAALASTLPHAADFMLEVLHAATEAPFGSLAWPEINRLAARWLRPDGQAGLSNTSQAGHAVVLEMVACGLLDAEVTTTGAGAPMVARVLHPRIFGLDFGRSLAA